LNNLWNSNSYGFDFDPSRQFGRLLRLKLFPLLILGLIIATVVGFWATSVATLTLFPTMDNYAWQSVPYANNGHSDNFQITSATVDPKNMRGWVAFDVKSIPSDVLVVRADFRLRVWSRSENDSSKGFGDSIGRVYGVYRVTQPWNETGENWANQPSYTEEHFASSKVPAGDTGWNGPLLFMDWDVTAILHDWQAGSSNYGFVVRDTQENSTILYSTQFFTHDQVPNQSYYPRLMVTYIPSQSLAALVGILLVEGLAAALIFRVRKKQVKNRTK
jgi:hypothetical protein